MLFVWIVLWLIAIVLLLSDPQKAATRWLSGVAWCGGFGAISVVIGDFIPAHSSSITEKAHTALEFIRIFSSLMQYYGLPYCFLMFAFSYNPLLPDRWKHRLLFLLPLPSIAMLLFIHPLHPINFPLAASWAIPYVLVGSYWVLRKKEKLPSLRQNHRFTSLAVIPAVILCSIMNFILPLFGLEEMYRYNAWIIFASAIMFIIAIFNYGFMGIQFIFYKRKMEFTFRTITSGTSILNHAIKNDIGKMKLYCDKIKTYAEETHQAELASEMQIILSSTRHIQDMIERVHQQTQETVMKMDFYDPSVLIEQILMQSNPLLTHIIVKTSFRGKWELYIDPIHIGEVLNNLITNAVDAMPQGGELKIRLFETKKQVILQVKDNGTGIEKQHLKFVLDPFFTTKSRLNFGLGLAYSYNIMKKHNGDLELDSEAGKGTSVYLSFPKKRRPHGENQSTAH
jgi:signal transduction histidine kinase